MSNPYLNWDQERGHADPQNPESQTPEEIARNVMTGEGFEELDLEWRIRIALRSEREKCEAMREALKSVMDQIACGALVRETADDASPGWGMRQLPLVMALKRADEALFPLTPKEAQS